jgi:hypothetical protein
MKCSRSDVQRKTHKIPGIRFEDQTLTSFSGLVVFQRLFAQLNLKERLGACFSHLPASPVFGHHLIVLLLVVHLLLGYRELRDSRYYRDDPLIKRLLGLRRLPDVATVSRALASAGRRSVEKLRELCRQLVLERLRLLGPRRLTLDFDGSVQSTCRRAEGTAVGFNKKKKGARSYYPLFCTIAQTGQVFDLLHRSGNVHDSNGATPFIIDCIHRIRAAVPGIKIEARMDSAFFSAEIVGVLEAARVDFTLSVPFERFAELKAMIEGRRRWRRFNSALSFFETPWKPKKWKSRYRFLFIRERVTRQHKGPLQLDLFVPHQPGYDFKVIVTNKQARMKKVLAFHNGRGAQEGVFAELKSHCQMDYVPVRTRVGNQIFLLSAVLAHNLTRELQMAAHPPQRATTEKRTPLWIFQQLSTLRRNLIQRAGRLTHPQGTLTLTMSGNVAVKHELLHYLHMLRPAA